MKAIWIVPVLVSILILGNFGLSPSVWTPNNAFAQLAITNVELAASNIQLDGNTVAFLVRESDQGTDLNGDLDTSDDVLHVYDVSRDTTTNVGLAASTFQLDGNTVAFQVRESAQGGTDLNGDSDAIDRVLHVVDLLALEGVTIGPGSTIGDGTTFGEDATVGSDSTIGGDTTIEEGAIVGDDSTIGDDATIGENVQIGDDTVIGNNVSIGEGSVIGNNVSIGDNVEIQEGVTILDGAVVPDDAVILEGETFP